MQKNFGIFLKHFRTKFMKWSMIFSFVYATSHPRDRILLTITKDYADAFCRSAAKFHTVFCVFFDASADLQNC